MWPPRIGVISQERAFFPAVATRSGIGARRASGKKRRVRTDARGV